MDRHAKIAYLLKQTELWEALDLAAFIAELLPQLPDDQIDAFYTRHTTHTAQPEELPAMLSD